MGFNRLVKSVLLFHFFLFPLLFPPPFSPLFLLLFFLHYPTLSTKCSLGAFKSHSVTLYPLNNFFNIHSSISCLDFYNLARVELLEGNDLLGAGIKSQVVFLPLAVNKPNAGFIVVGVNGSVQLALYVWHWKNINCQWNFLLKVQRTSELSNNLTMGYLGQKEYTFVVGPFESVLALGYLSHKINTFLVTFWKSKFTIIKNALYISSIQGWVVTWKYLIYKLFEKIVGKTLINIQKVRLLSNT